MTTKANALPIVHGAVGATKIASNCAGDDLATKRYVTLSANYARSCPADYPDPNPGLGAQASLTAASKMITNGTRVQLFAGEAAALVAAGAASYS